MDISHLIAEFIIFIGHQAKTFWDNLLLLNFSAPQIILDILLVAIIFYYLFSLLKGTRTVSILIGLSVVAFVFALSRIFQLVTLGWLLDRFLTIGLVAIPVIFQQELRMALERLGNTKFFRNEKTREIHRMVNNIVEACVALAKEKQGALIVLQRNTPLKEYVDTGIKLNAHVSKELLISIFSNHGPLHDGAAIIGDQNIMGAACLLPHSFSKNNLPLMGTRHKAALSLSETTDALIVVISEEKGTISFAHHANLERAVSAERLHFLLLQGLKPPKTKKVGGRRT